MSNLLWALDHGAASYLVAAAIVAVFLWAYWPSHREEVTFTEGSTNVFADLGMPDAVELQSKAELSRIIWLELGRRRWTILETSMNLGISGGQAEALHEGRLGGLDHAWLQSVRDKLINWQGMP